MNTIAVPQDDVAAFRRLSAGAQLKQLRGMKVERTFHVETRDGIDVEARTAWLSIASNQPYERWWGVETLDMSRNSIRADRLKRGLSILVDHNAADIVGKAESYQITSNGKLRLLARFGRSARAEEIWQDVLDGIRTDTSVGYVVHDLVLERQDGNLNYYRVTDWEPLEGSLVSIPADPTVGVGRSAELLNFKGKKMADEDEVIETQQLSRSQRRARAAADGGESERVAGLVALSELNMGSGLDAFTKSLCLRLIKNGGTEEDFKREIFAEQGLRSAVAAAKSGGSHWFPPESPLSDPANEEGRRAFYGQGSREIMGTPKYFTGPNAEQRAYRSGMFLKAQYGDQKASAWCRQNGIEVRAMSGQVMSQGGALVPDEMSQAIIDLCDSYSAFRQNADVWPMNSDTLSVPRSSGDPTTGFLGQNEALNESEGSWGVVNLSANKLGTIVRVPTELMEDAVINVADRVAFQLARAFSKKEDECGFIGDGTSTYGGMSGIFTKLVDGTHNASKVVAATNHDLFSEIDATDLSNLIAAVPEYAVDGSKFYCSNLAWSTVFLRLMMASGGNAISDLSGKVPKSYAGYPVVTSPVLPAGASTDYTGLVMIAFGNLRLSSKFGARRDIRIQILTETYANYDQVGIMATERFNIVNHDLGDNTTAGPMVGLIGA